MRWAAEMERNEEEMVIALLKMSSQLSSQDSQFLNQGLIWNSALAKICSEYFQNA
jgi:hypothetical protein